ncbi:hypothetical protein ACVWYF_001877 [Hymenobacter sp. UYAg731]
MADSSKNKKADNANAEIQTGDPLFNLHHAQAESELAKHNGGLGPTTNVYVTNDEEENIDEASAPIDSQGFTRGADEPGITGSNAGDHK